MVVIKKCTEYSTKWVAPEMAHAFPMQIAAHPACLHQKVHRVPRNGSLGVSTVPGAPGRSIGYEPSRPTGRTGRMVPKSVEGNKTRTGENRPKEGKNNHRMGFTNTRKGNLKPQTRPGVRQVSLRNGSMSGDKEGGIGTAPCWWASARSRTFTQ